MSGKKLLVMLLGGIFVASVFATGLVGMLGSNSAYAGSLTEETKVERLIDFQYSTEEGQSGAPFENSGYTLTPSADGGKDGSGAVRITGKTTATVWVRNFFDIGNYKDESLPTSVVSEYNTLRVVCYIPQGGVSKIDNFQLKFGVGNNTTTVSYLIQRAELSEGWNKIDVPLSNVWQKSVATDEELSDLFEAQKFTHAELVVPFSNATEDSPAELVLDDITLLQKGNETYVDIIDGQDLAAKSEGNWQCSSVMDAGKQGDAAYVVKGYGTATLWLRDFFDIGAKQGDMAPSGNADQFKYCKIAFYISDKNSIDGFNIKFGVGSNQNGMIYNIACDQDWKNGWNEVVFDLTDKANMTKALIGGAETDDFDGALVLFKENRFTHLEVVAFMNGYSSAEKPCELRLDGVSLYSANAKEICIPAIDVSSLPVSGTFHEDKSVTIDITGITAKSYSGEKLDVSCKVFKDTEEITLTDGKIELLTAADAAVYKVVAEATDSYGQLSRETVTIELKYGLEPTIDHSMVLKQYDVYGETVDLTQIIGEVADAPDMDVELSFKVTSPDGTVTNPKQNFKLTQAGSWTVEVSAKAGETTVTDSFTIEVADTTEAGEAREETVLDFSKKATTTDEAFGGIHGVWGSNGVTLTVEAGGVQGEGTFWLTGGTIAENNTDPAITTFKLSDYGSLNIKYSSASDANVVLRMSIVFNADYASGCGADFYGYMRYIDPMTLNPEGGVITLDLSTFNATGAKNESAGKTVDVNDVLNRVEVVVWIAGSEGANVSFESIELSTARYAPKITLNEEEIQKNLYLETTEDVVDVSKLYTASHDFDLTFSNLVNVTLFKNGSPRAIDVENEKFHIYESGSYEVVIAVTDENGSKTSKSFRITVTGEDIDKVAPTISTTGFNTIYTAFGEIDLSSITATDNISAPSDILLSFRVVSPDNAEKTLAEGEKKFTADKNGTWTVYITATDSAGNVSTKTVKVVMNDKEQGETPTDSKPGCSGSIATGVAGCAVFMLLAAILILKKRAR